VFCPTLAFFGGNGTMAKNFDIPVEWRKRCANVKEESLPGGHFFIDQFPKTRRASSRAFSTESRLDLHVDAR